MPAKKNKIEKKQWKITSKEGNLVEFFPVFEMVENAEDVSQVAGDAECRYVQIKTKDSKGNEVINTFDYLNLYMFFYFIASEELRINLAKRHDRQISMIPYDVSFTLDAKEKQMAKVTRRIEVPIDEVTMAVARQRAYEMTSHELGKGRTLDPKDFIYKKKR